MYWSSIDCLLGLFFSCYIFVVKLVDFMVDDISKPCSFFCAFDGDVKVIFNVDIPLNWGWEEFLFIFCKTNLKWVSKLECLIYLFCIIKFKNMSYTMELSIIFIWYYFKVFNISIISLSCQNKTETLWNKLK